jgi:hypothetical protein
MGLCVLGALLVPPAGASATGLTPFTTVTGTDFAIFGAGGMRGQGTGSIVVTGVSGSVTAAYLFWQGPTNDSGDSNAAVTFDGTGIVGVNMGETASNGWPFTNSKAYSATVTGLVNGNGTYALSNFVKTGPPAAEINGVTLLVFFSDGNAANDRDVVVFTGNDSNTPNVFDTNGWDATLSGINFPGGTVNMQLVVSDGQALPDDELKVNGATLLSSGAANWHGIGVPDQGTASTTNGGLWDHRSFDVTAFMNPGPNTLQIEPTLNVNDSVSLIAVIVDSAAVAPPPPPPPSVTSVSPGSGSTLGGTPITIGGASFVSGATVTIGGVAASSVVVVNATSITATTGVHAAGAVAVAVTNPDAQTGSLTNGYLYVAPSAGSNFYTLPPCRIVDTRNADGPLAGPALQPNATRLFVVTNACGVPSSAVSISVNATVVPTGSGFLALYPGNGLFTGASTLSFSAGQVRANNALVLLATDGTGGVKVLNSSTAANHFILDVNGYFE